MYKNPGLLYVAATDTQCPLVWYINCSAVRTIFCYSLLMHLVSRDIIFHNHIRRVGPTEIFEISVNNISTKLPRVILFNWGIYSGISFPLSLCLSLLSCKFSGRVLAQPTVNAARQIKAVFGQDPVVVKLLMAIAIITPSLCQRIKHRWALSPARASQCPYNRLCMEIIWRSTGEEHCIFNIFFNILGCAVTRHAYYVLTKTVR